MRSIRELLMENSKVWFYFSSDEWGKKFAQEAMETGIRYADGSPVEDIGLMISIDSDLKASRISLMIWDWSFGEGFIAAPPHIKVDYGKYVSGEVDYLIRNNVFRRI